MSRLSHVLCLIGAATLTAGSLTAAGDLGWFNPKQLPPPLKLLATTAMSGAGQDYFSLQPGQTATIGTVTGPAIITRIWSTSSNTKLSSLEMTVDGKKESLVVKGALPPGVANEPLRTLDMQAYWSYRPVFVKQHAVFKATSFEKGTTEPMKFYLQVGYRQVTAEELATARRASVSLARWAQRLSRDPVLDLPSLRRVATLTPQQPVVLPSGPLAVRVVALAMDPAASPQQLQATRLIVTCDNIRTVDAPLGLLFGIGHKRADYTSALLAVQGTKLIIRAPMFAAQQFQIALDNAGGKGLASVQVQAVSESLKAAPKYRFCAQTFAQYSVTDQPMTLLNVTGEGLFVGTNLSVDGNGRRTFAFLEGNEQIVADGAAKPTVEGTGTEDYFNGAWYFESGEKAHLFSGVTYKLDKDPASGEPAPQVDCYRYLLSDAIPFQQGLRFDLQHGSRNKAPDVLYEGVMFWYQASPAGVAEPAPAKVPAPAKPTAQADEGEGAGGLGPVAIAVIGCGLALVLLGSLGWWFMRRKRA